MRTRDVQQTLRNLGWDDVSVDGVYGAQTREAVRNFQEGFAFWDIGIDGEAGPQTWAALRHAAATGGKCSANFRFVEFRCKCGGKYRTCQRIKVHRDLVRKLEEYRRRLRRGVSVRSGYRCYSHNKAVGGASRSQHLYGRAADIVPYVHWTVLVAWRLFSGIGFNESTKRVAHVDNRTNASSARPTVWRYGR